VDEGAKLCRSLRSILQSLPSDKIDKVNLAELADNVPEVANDNVTSAVVITMGIDDATGQDADRSSLGGVVSPQDSLEFHNSSDNDTQSTTEQTSSSGCGAGIRPALRVKPFSRFSQPAGGYPLDSSTTLTRCEPVLRQHRDPAMGDPTNTEGVFTDRYGRLVNIEGRSGGPELSDFVELLMYKFPYKVRKHANKQDMHFREAAWSRADAKAVVGEAIRIRRQWLLLRPAKDKPKMPGGGNSRKGKGLTGCASGQSVPHE